MSALQAAMDSSTRLPGLVSVIIPVYNRAELLVEAVNSVLQQTYRPIEIIIVDDGSTDETPNVANSLAEQHADEVRVCHLSNGGPGRAREAGRRLVRGEFVQHLDSDDLLLPRKFELQVCGLREHPECGISYGKTRFYTFGSAPSDIPWKRTGKQMSSLFPLMLRYRWWGTSTPLYRRELIDRAGPWIDSWNEEDWEYDCRMASYGVQLHYCNEFVSEQRAHEGARLTDNGAANIRKLRCQARARELIYTHARRYGIPDGSEDLYHFSRAAFRLARRCGVAGLGAESRQLLDLAGRSGSPMIGRDLDFRIYCRAASLVGATTVARSAAAITRLPGIGQRRNSSK